MSSIFNFVNNVKKLFKESELEIKLPSFNTMATQIQMLDWYGRRPISHKNGLRKI